MPKFSENKPIHYATAFDIGLNEQNSFWKLSILTIYLSMV